MIVINGSTWDLKLVKKNDKRLRRSDGSTTIGVSDNNTKTIYIYDGLSEYMFYKVLCHELTHCFSFEFDLYIPIEIEEMIADFMSCYGKDIIYIADDIMRNIFMNVA